MDPESETGSAEATGSPCAGFRLGWIKLVHERDIAATALSFGDTRIMRILIPHVVEVETWLEVGW